jgi:ATP-binding cassette subfamily C protein CydD
VWAATLGQWVLVASFITGVVGGASPADRWAELVGAAAAWGIRSAAVAIRERDGARTSSRVRRSLRAQLAETVLRLGPEWAGDERRGEIVTTATDGVTRLDAYLARLGPAAVSAAVVPPLMLGTVAVLDPASGLLLLLGGALMMVFLWLVGTRATRSAAAQWAALGQLGAMLVDTLRVLPTLVVFGRAGDSTGWLAGLSESYRARTMRVLRTAFLSGFVLEFGATLCTALVAVTVGVRLFEGGLEFPRALLVLLLTPEFFAPLRALGAERHAALEGRPAAERLFALLDTPVPAHGDRPVPPGIPGVRLRDVTVRRAGAEVLAGLSLDLPPGSRTALVGPSGVGKSTVLRVLLGFLTPDGGDVLVDGVPLTAYDPQSWRQLIAYVPERPWLSPGSVAANVRLGRPDATDSDVQRALRQAGLADVVDALPDGMQTPLGEDGARLSGGERLRIALARAFLKDAPILLLDEPTAQLDEDTEARLLAVLAELAVGRTVLTVTHRSAPLALHDRVFALADGVVEDLGVVR